MHLNTENRTSVPALHSVNTTQCFFFSLVQTVIEYVRNVLVYSWHYNSTALKNTLLKRRTTQKVQLFSADIAEFLLGMN